MSSNSTDEDEILYHVFDITKMDKARFELRMLFPSAKVFRDAVRKQEIVDRRPIK